MDIEAAMFNPASIFKRPAEVLKEASLSRQQKIEILRRWAYDEREMAVAEEENMTIPGADKKNNNVLDEILKSLLELGVEGDEEKPAPTKQG